MCSVPLGSTTCPPRAMSVFIRSMPSTLLASSIAPPSCSGRRPATSTSMCDRCRVSWWYSPCCPGTIAPMSPKRSKTPNVSPLLSTCGCSSRCASVARTYHWSSNWIFFLVECMASGGQALPLLDQVPVHAQIAARHLVSAEPPLENLAAGGAVDFADAPRRRDRLALVVHDEPRAAVVHELGD